MFKTMSQNRKREIGGKISDLNTNMQLINSRIDTIMNNIIATNVHQTTTFNVGDLINELADLKIKEEKSKRMNNAGIRKGLDPTQDKLVKRS